MSADQFIEQQRLSVSSKKISGAGNVEQIIREMKTASGSRMSFHAFLAPLQSANQCTASDVKMLQLERTPQ